MTVATYPRSTATESPAGWSLSSRHARAIIAAATIAAGVGGFMATDATTAARAVTAAGPDLTRLLRAMAVIKALLGAGALAEVFWRLSSPVGALRLALYAAACAAMAAGSALIWSLAGVGVGALLLHAGLAITVIMLWRDPVVDQRLARLVAHRRASRARSP